MNQELWLVRTQGRIQGPFDRTELQNALAEGKLDLASEVAMSLQRWRPLKDVYELREIMSHIRDSNQFYPSNTATMELETESSNRSINQTISLRTDPIKIIKGEKEISAIETDVASQSKPIKQFGRPNPSPLQFAQKKSRLKPYIWVAVGLAALTVIGIVTHRSLKMQRRRDILRPPVDTAKYTVKDALMAYRTGDLQKSESALMYLEEQQKLNPDLQIMLAAIKVGQGRALKRIYETLEKLDVPSNDQQLLDKVQVLKARIDASFERNLIAEKNLKSNLPQSIHRDLILATLAGIYRKMGKFDKAKETYDEIKFDPTLSQSFIDEVILLRSENLLKLYDIKRETGLLRRVQNDLRIYLAKNLSLSLQASLLLLETFRAGEEITSEDIILLRRASLLSLDWSRYQYLNPMLDTSYIQPASLIGLCRKRQQLANKDESLALIYAACLLSAEQIPDALNYLRGRASESKASAELKGAFAYTESVAGLTQKAKATLTFTKDLTKCRHCLLAVDNICQNIGPDRQTLSLCAEGSFNRKTQFTEGPELLLQAQLTEKELIDFSSRFPKYIPLLKRRFENVPQ